MSKNVGISLVLFTLALTTSACAPEEERQDSVQCTVATTDQATTITCPDGTTSVIPHGKDGAPGSQGTPGEKGEKGAAGPIGDTGPAGEFVASACVLSRDIIINGDSFETSPEIAFLEANDCQIIVGNIEVSNQAIPPILAKITHIYGNLTLIGLYANQPGGDLGAFTDLTMISGDLAINQTELLKDDTFPALTSIGRDLEFNDSYQQETLNMFIPLTSIGGNLSIIQNSALKDVNGLFQNLTKLAGDQVYVQYNSFELDECVVLQKLRAIPDFAADVTLSSQGMCV